MKHQRQKVLVVGSLAESLIVFRGALLEDIVALGHRAAACAPHASEKVRGQLRAMGVEYHHYDLDRTGFNPVRDSRSFYQLVRLFKRVAPDIVLLYTMKPVLYGSLAAWLAGVPVISSMITGLGYLFSTTGLRQSLLAPLIRVSLRTSLGYNQAIFFQNPDNLAEFKRLGILQKPERAFIINGSGVAVDRYAPQPLPEEISFLLIARLLQEKGVREYVDAARITRGKYPEVRFRIAGWIDDHPSSITSQELRSWTKEGVVEFLGRLEDVRPAIAASSVYVLPSYAEGTPRTVLEAMSMGRCVITTDAPGCRETVLNGVNGFLVPVKDPAALAERMDHLIRHRQLIAKMGEEGRRIAIEKYDVREVNKSILGRLGLQEAET